MKILFIYSLHTIESTARPLHSQAQIQFGISYISSFLQKYNHQTKLIVLSRVSGKKNIDIINEYLRNFYPRLICFTSVSTEYSFIRGIAKYIKSRYPDIYLLIGGPHVSLNPDGVLSDGFDALCIGEGEYAVLELVSQLTKDESPSNIQNLWIKDGYVIEKNSSRPFLQNLDSLPFPDREMWQEWIVKHHKSRYSVLLGRGCPFRCSYCCNHAFKKLAPGSYVRVRSPENIIEEIKEIALRFPEEKEIYLEIESFGVNQEWALKVCEKIEELNTSLIHPLSFGVNIRITPNANFEPLFSACKRSNFRFVNIGLESGSERIRSEILRRDYSNKDVINTVQLAKKFGLQVAFFNMVGIPGETIVDFEETVKINRICDPDWHFTSIFFPYPGTDLYLLCQEQGLLKKSFLENRGIERQKAIIDFPKFSKKQIEKCYSWFEYYVYRQRQPICKILARMGALKITTNPYLTFLVKKFLHLSFLNWLRIIFRKIRELNRLVLSR